MSCQLVPRTRRLLGAVLGILLCALPASIRAATQTPQSERVQAPVSVEQSRLIALGKLWITVKYFHPALPSSKIDWDRALVDALPAIRSASDQQQLTVAIRQMLSVLQDSLTRVELANASGLTEPETVETNPGPRTQQFRIHYGLASAKSSAFYEAVGFRAGTQSSTVIVPFGDKLVVRVRTSQAAAWNEDQLLGLREKAYDESPYPSTELRILSAYRIWGAIHYFFAYKDLMDEDWDAVFADELPKFIAAKDAQAYHLAVAEMISRLSDSNSTAQSPELNRYFGEGSPGLQVRLIEKRAVVTAVSDTGSDIHVGDVITAVDGEKVSDRVKREANYLSASTAQGLSAVVVQKLLNGPVDSVASLQVSDADNRSRSVQLKRGLPQIQSAPTSASPYRLLPGNVGYADLTHLRADEVDGMFEKLKDAPSIIFDARGPVGLPVASVASRLTDVANPTMAIVTGPIASEPDLPGPGVSGPTSSSFAFQTIPPSNKPKYKGKTVLLIDERTIGNAEHLGLALEVANRTECLGTPSAGADSDLTQFVVPGNLTITFSGHDIRHANAGPIQRMGLQPALPLAPKVTAIRQGRDVVLEKALEYVRPPATQASVLSGG